MALENVLRVLRFNWKHVSYARDFQFRKPTETPILLLLADGKFHQLPSGELLIHNLEFSDQFATYRCRTMHRLSRQVVISSAANVNIAGEPLHFVH